MINVVIPMAGKGQRFLDKGIKTPKPLIKVNSKPFISHVIDSVNFDQANFFFLIRDEHLKNNNFDEILKSKKILIGSTIIGLALLFVALSFL